MIAAATIGAAQVSLAKSSNPWAEQAWDYYDAIGELRYASNWLGNALSRATLYVAKTPDQGGQPERVEDDEAQQALYALAGGLAGQSEMLKAFGIHLTIAGDCYLVGFNDPKTKVQRWVVRSPEEVNAYPGTVIIKIDGTTLTLPEDDVALIRIWRPHPRRSWEADSPTRGVLPVLYELERLTQMVAAQANSRLAGAGLLIIPAEFDFPTPPGYPGDADSNPQVSKLQSFVNRLGHAMITPVTDRSDPNSVVPVIVTAPGDQIGNVKLIQFWTPLDGQAIELRKEAIRRFALGMDMPPEILLGMGGTNHWCTLPDVEIMTDSGWRTYDQLVPGDLTLTLNHETGLSEWQPVLAVNTWEVTGEDMIRIEGRRHRSVTTAAHRWPILSGRPAKRGRDWITSGEIMHAAREDGDATQRQDYFILAAPHAGLPADAKYSDALVEMVAWYYTEGTKGIRAGRNTPKVVIHQSAAVNQANCARIERALHSLFGPASDKLDKGGRYASDAGVKRWQQANSLRSEGLSVREIAATLGVSDVSVYTYLSQAPKIRDERPRWRITQRGDMNHYILNAAAAEVILAHAPQRIVSREFIRELTYAQLELFLDVSVRGDGHYMHGKTPVFSQKDPAANDAFELAAILAGKSPTRNWHTSTGLTANGPAEKTVETVIVSEQTTFAPRGRSFSTEKYTGTIWCPTTPNGTWLARHEGRVFYTGNSGWQIDEAAIKLHIEPLLSLVCDALTVGFLQPLLGDDTDRMIWFDTTELVQRPNRAPDAFQLHDRYLLSDENLVKETGFTKEQMPTDEEKNDRQLRKMVDAGGAGMAEQASISLGIFEAAPEEPAPQDNLPAEQAPPAEVPAQTPAEGTPENPGPPAGGAPSQTASAAPASAGIGGPLVLLTPVLVAHALDYLGKRWLKGQPRGAYPKGLETHRIHEAIPVPEDRIDGLLQGAFDALRGSAPDTVIDAVTAYVREIAITGRSYDPQKLIAGLSGAVPSRNGHLRP
jgi:hypothetical protein